MVFKWFLLFAFSCGLSFAARKAGLDDCPMCDYVYLDDGHFAFSLLESVEIVPGVTSYKLNVTSLKWNDENFTTQPVWHHIVVIHVPDVRQHNTVLMVFAGDVLHNPISLNGNRRILRETARIASETKTVTAAAYYIPNEPITFITPGGPLTLDADGSIVYTQVLFQKFPFPQTTVLSPLIKAGIKTMDAVEQFLSEQNIVNGEIKFVLQGESKRAYAVWIGAAIDDRVVAIIPQEGNFLNSSGMTYHAYKAMNGSWPWTFAPYRDAGLLSVLESASSLVNNKLIDPLEYKEHLRLPKLIVLASSDSFFISDNTEVWFNEVLGENKIWYLENSGHFINFYPTYSEFWSGSQAFYQTILENQARPKIRWWKKVSKAGRGKISVSTNVQPTQVTAFMANSVVSFRRDFRRFILCPNCPPVKLCATCPAVPLYDTGDIWTEKRVRQKKTRKGQFRYSVRYRTPAVGYRAFYIKMKFSNGLIFTTDFLVLPNSYPTDVLCVGAECDSKPLA